MGLMLVALVCLAPVSAKAKDLRVITIGGAGLYGNYYAIAKALCEKINSQNRGNLRCSPESTSGSLYNLFAMRRGELDFALVQSDWQREATEGTGVFLEDGPMTELRSVATLYQEEMTLVVKRFSGINGVEDLEGRIVDVGHPSTARRGTVMRLMEAMEFPSGAIEYRGLSGLAVRDALCDGSIDATLLVFGHPNAAIGQALSACDLEIVPVTGRKVDALLAQSEEYTLSIIPAQTYPEMSGDVATYAVAASIVVREDIPDEIVTLFLTTLLENYGELREVIPVLPPEPPISTHDDGLSAEMHPGAVSVFDALSN